MLADPGTGGFNLTLWLVPIVIVLLAVAGIGVAYRRWRARAGSRGRAAAAAQPRGRAPPGRGAGHVTEGVDTTVIAAFAVGFISFISPCVLPLVPGYLSAVSGLSLAEMKSGERGPLEDPAAGDRLLPVVHGRLRGARHDRHRARLDAAGLSARRSTRSRALVIIALGVFFLLTPFVPRLNQEWRPDALISRAGSGGPIVAGAAFAVAWTPCIGPTLGSILSAAATQDTVGKGGDPARVLLARARRPVPAHRDRVHAHDDRVPLAARPLPDHHRGLGRVLITMGLLLFTGELARLNIEAQRALDELGINFFKSV